MEKKIKHDFQHASWVGLSTGTNALLAFAAGVLLVRYLPPRDYGFLSSVIAVLLVAQEFVGRGLNDGMVRLGTKDAAGSVERSFNVFWAALILKIFFSFVIIVLSLAFSTEIEQLLKLQGAVPALLAAIIGYGIWTYLLAWLQARMAFAHLAALQPISTLLRLSCYIGLIATARFHWKSALWSMAAAFWIAILITGKPLLQELLSRRIQRTELNKALTDIWRCTRWSILAAVAFVTLTRMDIFTMVRYVSVNDVALYNAAWQVLVILDLATVTIMTVMVPKVAHCTHYTETKEWAKRSLLLSLTAGVLTLPLLLLPQWYIPIIFGNHYMPSIEIVQILYWGNLCGLMSFPLVGILFARNAFHLNATIQITLLVVSIPLYLYVVKDTGIIGAAWVTLGLRAANSFLIFCCAGFLLKRSPC